MTRLQTIPRLDLSYTLGDLSGRRFNADSHSAAPAKLQGVLAPGRAFWTGSGRQALWPLLKALRLKAGSDVAIPLYGDPAVPIVANEAGLTPVLGDSGEETLTMDPASLEGLPSQVTPVAPVHLFEQATPLVSEDTVRAPLSMYRGQLVGSFGVGNFCSSAVAADSDAADNEEDETRTLAPRRLDERVHSLFGRGAKALVLSGRLDGLFGRTFGPLANLEPALDRAAIQPGHAAIAFRQLTRFGCRLEAQRRNSLQLLDMLSGLEDIVLPWERPAYRFHLFPVLLRNMDEQAAVANLMLKRHVATSRIYRDAVLHSLRLGYEHNSPRSESAARRLLTLPNHASLSETDVAEVAEVFMDAVKGYRAQAASRQFSAFRSPVSGTGDDLPALAAGTLKGRKKAV
jgi:dTDP-4-amino-4,6-dideoxygalactose transaminase